MTHSAPPRRRRGLGWQAETYGLRRENGAEQFRRQGYHVRVQAGELETE